MSVALNNCGDCRFSESIHFQPMGNKEGVSSQLVCKNRERIDTALEAGENVLFFRRIDGSGGGSPTSVDGICNQWGSREATGGYPSVSTQALAQYLPKDTMLLENYFRDGRQTIEVGSTNDLIQRVPVLMEILVGQNRFTRTSAATVPLAMAGTIFSAQTYEIER